MTYTLFHGSKKNVGDYLIRSRARELLLREQGLIESDLLEVEAVRRTESEMNIDEITKTDAVIIAGGPAYQESFADIYPTLDAILDAGIPVIPLGPGWKGKGEDDYEFTDESVELLQRIHSQIEFSGVRDLPTKRVLAKHGISNVELVGCPAWYDFKHLGESFYKPDSIESIAISTVVPRSKYHRKQFRYLLRRVREEYPDATLMCSFHRGIYHDEHTPFVRSLHLRRFKWTARRYGYTVFNPAYEPERLRKYEDIDVHIGYRVHGHIYFLAMRHPSYLFQVDGRGTGVTESIRSPGDVQAFGLGSVREPVEEILSNLERDRKEGFTRFDDTSTAIEETKPKMDNLIETLP